MNNKANAVLVTGRKTQSSRYNLLFWLFTLALFTSLCSTFSEAQADVTVQAKAGADIGAEVNAAIAALPNESGTVHLPAGSHMQSKTITVTGTGIHIEGAPEGTTLTFDPSHYHLVDSADSTNGWQGQGVNVSILTSAGEDHPEPMEGIGYIQVATGSGSVREVSKAVPRTDFESASKIGIWFTLNLTKAQQPIEFFVSDGTHTAFWKMTPPTIYASWVFLPLDRAHPTGTDGGLPDMKNIKLVGFRGLIPNAKYYFDAISLYDQIGSSVVFSSCVQCSLQNVTIHWEPASDSDSVVRAVGNTRDLVLDHVQTTGGAMGIELSGPSMNTSCKACNVQQAHSGIALDGNTSGNRLLNDEVNRNVNGIYIATGANHNTISSAHSAENNAADILINGDDNQLTNSYVGTWMTFGLVISGGSHNSVTALTAHSAIGESAVQLVGGASYNTLSTINIEQSGGSGLDMGGGSKPQDHNIAKDVFVHYSGSSSWHGGPNGSSEGRGLCLCYATDNTITHLEIYDTGQRSTAQGVEGIIICCNSTGNILEDVLIYHSRHEGITVWDASNNTLRNVRLLGNGLKENRAGLRIEGAAQNTVVENLCYWMNGAGGIKNVSKSSAIRQARQVKGLNPNAACQ